MATTKQRLRRRATDLDRRLPETDKEAIAELRREQAEDREEPEPLRIPVPVDSFMLRGKPAGFVWLETGWDAARRKIRERRRKDRHR